MKQLLILAFSLITLTSFGQGFPTIINGSVSTKGDYKPDFVDWCRREGKPFDNVLFPTSSYATTTWNNGAGRLIWTGQVYNNNGAQLAANNVVQTPSYIGRLFFFQYLTLTPTANCFVQITYRNTEQIVPLFANVAYVLQNIICTGNDPLIIKLYSLTGNNDATALSIYINISQGYDVAQDFRDDATDGVILNIGDSITYGIGGAVYPNDLWTYQFLEYWNRRGYKFRMSNQAAVGKTSTDIYQRMLGRNYNVPNVRIITYMLGTNDVANASNLSGGVMTTAALTTYYNNIQAAITWRSQYHRGSLMFLLGPTPTTTTQNESNLVLCRQKMRQAVLDWKAANPVDSAGVRFIDMGGSTTEWPTPAFDKTATNAMSNDPHLGTVGNLGVSGRLATYCTQNGTLVPKTY